MFRDRLIFDKARVNSDGYMAIRARAARTGIYDYLGIEVDPEGKHFAADEIIKVYRPPEEVFDRESLASYVGKPITNDHPAEPVTSANWRDVAGGTIMSACRETIESGDFITFDLAFMDADLIRDIESGKRELSNGYGAEVIVKDGITEDGEPYQAIQTNMRGNHVAVVDRGRAGSQCRIGDAAPCEVIDANTIRPNLISGRTYADRFGDVKTGSDTQPKDAVPMAKMMVIDGLQVDISNVDTAEATIKTLMDKASAANSRAEKAEAEVATLTTDKAKLEAEKVTLEKRVEDVKPKPHELRDAAKRYARVCDMAEKMGHTVEEEEDEDAIKRKVVGDRLGDVAKDWTDAQIAASFESLCADLKDGPKAKTNASSPLRDAIKGAPRIMNVDGALKSYRDRRLRDMETRYSKTDEDEDEQRAH